MTKMINNKLRSPQPSKLMRFLAKLHPKKLDMLGSEIKFKYRDQVRFQTGLGGFLTLVVVLVTLAAFYSTIFNFIINPKPEVSVSTKYSNKAPKFNLYDEGISLGLAIHDRSSGTQAPANLPKYFTVKGYLQNLIVDPKSPTVEIQDPIEIDYKPCTKLKDQKGVEPFLEPKQVRELMFGYGLCPELDGLSEKYFVKSKFQDPPLYELYVYIYPCSLPNQDDCVGVGQLSNSLIYYTNIKKGVDPDNFTHPVSTLPEFDGILSLDPRNTKNLYFKVKSNEIWDDNLDFFDARLRTRYADYYMHDRDVSMRPPSQIYCTPGMIDRDLGACRPYAVYSWQSSGETQVMKRTYAKFFGSLGEVGGTAEILILFAVLLYTGYNSFFTQRYLVSELFKQHGGQEKIAEVFRQSWVPDDLYLQKRAESLKNGDQKSKLNSSWSIRAGIKVPDAEFKEIEKDERRVIFKAIGKNIEKNEDGVALYPKLNRLEFLETILFEEHDKVLMPIVLMNLLKTREREKEEEEKALKKGLLLGGKQEPQSARHKDPDEMMSIEEAYESLERSNPVSGVKQLIKSFILENLPSGVEKLAKIRKTEKARTGKPGGSGRGLEAVLEVHEDPKIDFEGPGAFVPNIEEQTGRDLLDGKRRPRETSLKGFHPSSNQNEKNLFKFNQRGQNRGGRPFSTKNRNQRPKMTILRSPAARDRLPYTTSSQRRLSIAPKSNRSKTKLTSRKMQRMGNRNQIDEEE